MKYIEKDEKYCTIVNRWLEKADDYNSDYRVRDFLRAIHKGKCAYCESMPEISGYFNIEHFYPKSKFDDGERKIENLHYSCEKCNKLKGSSTLNIISPNYYLDENKDWKKTSKEFVRDNIYYSGHLLFASEGSEIGNNTIDLFDLNNKNEGQRTSRSFLVFSRLKILAFALENLKIIYENLKKDDFSPTDDLQNRFDTLLEMMNDYSPFSTMIIENLATPIYQLLEIYKIKLQNVHI